MVWSLARNERAITIHGIENHDQQVDSPYLSKSENIDFLSVFS